MRRRSGSNTDPTIPRPTLLGDIILKMESFQAQMVELMSSRLQQVDENQAVLSDNIHTLNERCRSLQSQNDQLREDVEYMSAKCGAWERHCGQLYDGQYMLDKLRTTRDLDKQMDKPNFSNVLTHRSCPLCSMALNCEESIRPVIQSKSSCTSL